MSLPGRSQLAESWRLQDVWEFRQVDSQSTHCFQEESEAVEWLEVLSPAELKSSDEIPDNVSLRSVRLQWAQCRDC
jgi:hypothetical protein